VPTVQAAPKVGPLGKFVTVLESMSMELCGGEKIVRIGQSGTEI